MLRIDDLDRPRVRPGAEDEILRQLDAHGLGWDGPVRRQSEHAAEYEAALERLQGCGCLYACRCTRAQLSRTAPTPEPLEDGEAPYPGTCRDAGWPDIDAALRVRIGRGDVDGDFVVRRRDGQIGYQLACAIDEHILGITDVVRGADLTVSSRRQRWILERLGLPAPRYRHLPLILGADGRKLSKSTEAAPLRSDQAATNLDLALRLLGQEEREKGVESDPGAILRAAVKRWAPERISLEAVRIT